MKVLLDKVPFLWLHKKTGKIYRITITDYWVRKIADKELLPFNQYQIYKEYNKSKQLFTLTDNKDVITWQEIPVIGNMNIYYTYNQICNILVADEDLQSECRKKKPNYIIYIGIDAQMGNCPNVFELTKNG